jgi:hypothetical protein
VISELKKHPKDYAILLAVLIIFVAGFTLAWPNVLLQRVFVVFLGVCYFFWGVLHHHRSGMISTRVVLEYFFVSVLACCLLFLLT